MILPKTMDLIRSDESAACNAISVALLHVFVDRVDGWMGGLLLAGKVDFKEQRSPLLPRKPSICARSDRQACALSFSIHKIDLQPAQRSDIAPLPAVSEDPSLAPAAHRVAMVYHWLIDCWPLQTSCCFVAPACCTLPKYPRRGSELTSRGFMAAGK